MCPLPSGTVVLCVCALACACVAVMCSRRGMAWYCVVWHSAATTVTHSGQPAGGVAPAPHQSRTAHNDSHHAAAPAVVVADAVAANESFVSERNARGSSGVGDHRCDGQPFAALSNQPLPVRRVLPMASALLAEIDRSVTSEPHAPYGYVPSTRSHGAPPAAATASRPHTTAAMQATATATNQPRDAATSSPMVAAPGRLGPPLRQHIDIAASDGGVPPQNQTRAPSATHTVPTARPYMSDATEVQQVAQELDQVVRADAARYASKQHMQGRQPHPRTQYRPTRQSRAQRPRQVDGSSTKTPRAATKRAAAPPSAGQKAAARRVAAASKARRGKSCGTKSRRQAAGNAAATAKSSQAHGTSTGRPRRASPTRKKRTAVRRRRTTSSASATGRKHAVPRASTRVDVMVPHLPMATPPRAQGSRAGSAPPSPYTAALHADLPSFLSPQVADDSAAGGGAVAGGGRGHGGLSPPRPGPPASLPSSIHGGSPAGSRASASVYAGSVGAGSIAAEQSLRESIQLASEGRRRREATRQWQRRHDERAQRSMNTSVNTSVASGSHTDRDAPRPAHPPLPPQAPAPAPSARSQPQPQARRPPLPNSHVGGHTPTAGREHAAATTSAASQRAAVLALELPSFESPAKPRAATAGPPAAQAAHTAPPVSTSAPPSRAAAAATQPQSTHAAAGGGVPATSRSLPSFAGAQTFFEVCQSRLAPYEYETVVRAMATVTGTNESWDQAFAIVQPILDRCVLCDWHTPTCVSATDRGCVWLLTGTTSATVRRYACWRCLTHVEPGVCWYLRPAPMPRRNRPPLFHPRPTSRTRPRRCRSATTRSHRRPVARPQPR